MAGAGCCPMLNGMLGSGPRIEGLRGESRNGHGAHQADVDCRDGGSIMNGGARPHRFGLGNRLGSGPAASSRPKAPHDGLGDLQQALQFQA